MASNSFFLRLAPFSNCEVRLEMAGKDEWESAQCDMLVDGVHDFLNKFIQYLFEKDESRKVYCRAKFARVSIINF